MKHRPNHALYLRALRGMSPGERLAKAFELSEFSKGLFLDGLRDRFPSLDDAGLRSIYLDRLAKCHNRNY